MPHPQSFEDEFLSIGKYVLNKRGYRINDVLGLRFAGFDREHGYIGIAEIKVAGWKLEEVPKVSGIGISKLDENQYEISGTKSDILRLIRRNLSEER